MIYFMADPHLHHERSIEKCNRPFKTVQEMDETIINNCNSVVGPKDDLYIVGDFMFYGDANECNRLLGLLNGRKHLIIGNHDFNKVISASGWTSVQYYKKLKYNKHKFIIMHYPIASWQSKRTGSIMVHGHCHGTLNPVIKEILGRKIIDVGVDVWNFKPVSIDIILEIANKES